MLRIRDSLLRIPDLHLWLTDPDSGRTPDSDGTPDSAPYRGVLVSDLKIKSHKEVKKNSKTVFLFYSRIESPLILMDLNLRRSAFWLSWIRIHIGNSFPDPVRATDTIVHDFYCVTIRPLTF